jgi:hypothetical protein
VNYKAFISYSHSADDKLAPALQSALHRFAKPFYRLRAIRVLAGSSILYYRLVLIVAAVGIYLCFICDRWLATRASFFHLFFSAIPDLISCLRARYVSSFCNFS